MTYVRRPLIAALTLFTAAIALDRSGIGSSGDAVGTHAYVIAALAVVAPLVSPAIQHGAVWLMPVTAGGMLMSYSILGESGFFGAVGVHVAATEVAFVLVAAVLGRMLGAGLSGIDGLLTTAATGESPAIDLEGPLAANEIHTEMARSRRHDRPMSVTVLSPSARGLERALDSAAIEVDRAVRTRFLFGSLARTVSSVLRRSDLLFEHRATGRLIVLSPETDSAGTALLVERILAAVDRTGIDSVAGSASFPEDGIGFETLVERAEEMIAAQDEQPRLRAIGDGGSA